jgi:hypothetical protein
VEINWEEESAVEREMKESNLFDIFFSLSLACAF